MNYDKNGTANLKALKEMDALQQRNEKLEEAWLVADIGGALEIQKVDELDPDTSKKHVDRQAFDKCFFSDLEALGYVFARALAGDERCREVISQCYSVIVPDTSNLEEIDEDIVYGVPESGRFPFHRGEIISEICGGNDPGDETIKEIADILASNIEGTMDDFDTIATIDLERRNFNDSFGDMMDDLRERYAQEE